MSLYDRERERRKREAQEARRLEFELQRDRDREIAAENRAQYSGVAEKLEKLGICAFELRDYLNGLRGRA